MYPRPFDYFAPLTFADALEALSDQEGAKVMSGGMSLIPMMKVRVLAPAALVDLGRIPGFDTITTDDVVSIPALVRHRQVAADPEVQRHAAALSEAAAAAGDPQVRARGTTCGSMAHADPAGDQPAAAIALDSTVVATSRRGTRRIPARDFFQDTFSTALSHDEIVERIEVPLSAPGEGSAYLKIGRRGRAEGFPVAGVAVWVRAEGDGVVAARVAVTGVSSQPYASPGMEQALVGAVDTTTITAASQQVLDGIPVLADLHGGVAYKSHLASVLAARAAQAALARARRSLGRYDISERGGHLWN